MGVKLPDAPAANTWERDERLSHSQQAAEKDGSLKLHPLTPSFTINTCTVNTFPRAYPHHGYNILSRRSQSSPLKEVEVLLESSSGHPRLLHHPLPLSSPCDQCSPLTWTYIKAHFLSPSNTNNTAPPHTHTHPPLLR